MYINGALRGTNPDIPISDLRPNEWDFIRDLDSATNAEIVKQKKLWRSVDASAIGITDRDIEREMRKNIKYN